MSSISQFLPEPKHAGGRQQEPIEAAELAVVVAAAASNSTDSKIPAYGHRVGWVPKTASDFGDGGAYPEIHVLQFPLGMGRKQGKKGNALAKQVDKEGNVSYDALARFGRRENETVHSQFKDMVPLRQRKDFGDEESAIPQRPSEEEVREAAERTKLALDKISSGKANGSKGAVNGIGRTEPTFVRYTASSGTGQRIVRVSDMPVDPMEPPKVRHQKKARAPGSPPAPVMHSPPRKITADEQKEWSIPPCVSNWKNIHGFTVSLDKRLATDGRGMEELSVSDNFARLSEALGSAEALARREIQERAQIQQTLARREKEANEERLRLLAQRAREERATASATTTAGYVPPPAIAAASEAVQEQSKKSPVAGARGHESGRRTAADFFSGKASPSATPSLQRARDEDEEERDAMRRERHKERERAMRATRMGAEGKAKYLRSSENRDISEKIALGLAKPTAAGREGMYDSRLFNQASASNAALQNDEAYNLYDKPLFAARTGAGNYRPTQLADQGGAQDVERLMQSDRFGNELRGGSGGAPAPKKQGNSASGPRANPVEFEKGDVFGIDAFVSSTRRQDSSSKEPER